MSVPGVQGESGRLFILAATHESVSPPATWGRCWQPEGMGADADRLARRIVRERAVLLSHLPVLDPLRQLAPDDDSVEQHVRIDVDLAEYEAGDHQRRTLRVGTGS
jgi:hypothetical protein